MTSAIAGLDPEGWAVRRLGYFCSIGSPMASDVGMAALTGLRDLRKVRDALAAAGYRGETVVAIVAGEGKTAKPITDVVVDMLRKVGMTVDYQVMDFPTWLQRRNSKKPPSEGGWNISATGLPAMDCLTPANNIHLRGNGVRAPWARRFPPSSKRSAIAGSVPRHRGAKGDLRRHPGAGVHGCALPPTRPILSYGRLSRRPDRHLGRPADLLECPAAGVTLAGGA